jgi:hypothetical protein
VLSILIHYLDLITLRVGIPQADGTFCGLTMERIAELAGVGLRRAERAVADLVAGGLVTVHPIAIETAPGQFVGRAAIRTVNPALFAAFGLGKWLRYERERASARRRKRERKANAAGLAKIDLTIRGALHKAAGRAPKPAAPQENRTLQLKRLMEQYPDRPIEELVEMLRKQHPPP